MIKKIKLILVTVLLVFSTFNIVKAEDSVKKMLFENASKEFKKAKEANANLISPGNFKKGLEYFKEAQDDYKDGTNLDAIREELTKSAKAFSEAIKNVEMGRITFKGTLKARLNALEVKANENQAELWKEASEMFNDAAEEFEDGNLEDAKEKGANAEAIFRKAELEAIKSKYLNNARKLIAKADDIGIDDEANYTLKFSKELLKKAEKELNENRYDTDKGRDLAKKAEYEVKHALYLYTYIKKLKDQDKSYESIILSAEDELRKIAILFDFEAKFDKGLKPQSDEIVSLVKTMQDSLRKTAVEAGDYAKQITDLKTENGNILSKNKELEKKLGITAQEKSKLQKKIEAQQLGQKKFKDVLNMFLPSEAEVFKQSGNIVIRLTGIKFNPGASDFGIEYLDIIRKVDNALALYKNSRIIVEGHTDSYGNDNQNQILSEKRAAKIREILLKSALLRDNKFNMSQMSSVGYGETKPVASNSTRDGRDKNRRIDIIIYPAPIQ